MPAKTPAELIAYNILWNKMGSDAEVDASEKGTNGTRAGTITYIDVQYGKGAYSNNVADYIGFGNGQWFNPNKHIVDFYFKTDFSVASAVASDGASHTFYQWYENLNNTTKLVLVNGGNLYFEHRVNSSYFYPGATPGNVNWSANTKTRMTVAFDYQGIDGTSTVAKFYLDGVLIGSSTLAVSNQANAGTNFRTLDQIVSSAPVDGAIDNLQIYDNGVDANITQDVIDGVLAKNTEGFTSQIFPAQKGIIRIPSRYPIQLPIRG